MPSPHLSMLCTMSASITPAIIGLVGAVVGAPASLAGVLGSQRLQARRARRTALIDSFISTVGADSDGGGGTLYLGKGVGGGGRVGGRFPLGKVFSAQGAF